MVLTLKNYVLHEILYTTIQLEILFFFKKQSLGYRIQREQFIIASNLKSRMRVLKRPHPGLNLNCESRRYFYLHFWWSFHIPSVTYPMCFPESYYLLLRLGLHSEEGRRMVDNIKYSSPRFLWIHTFSL